MPRYDIQKFAVLAAEDKILNLDLTLGQIVRSKAIGSLVAYDDPWEVFCGNDLRLMIWPGPRVQAGSLFERPELARSVREVMA